MKLAHKLHASLVLATAGLLLSGIAAAQSSDTTTTTYAASPHDYRWVDGGIVDRDGSTGMGARIGGAAALTPPLALFGEVVDDDEYSQLSAGALFHTPIGPGLDFNAGGSVEIVDTGATDDTGFGARMGLRWRVPDTRGLELSPEVRHVMVFDNAITSLRIAALYPVARNLLAQGALQAGDDDRVEIGMRYNFGR